LHHPDVISVILDILKYPDFYDVLVKSLGLSEAETHFSNNYDCQLLIAVKFLFVNSTGCSVATDY
jgi:hypothetical protein